MQKVLNEISLKKRADLNIYVIKCHQLLDHLIKVIYNVYCKFPLNLLTLTLCKTETTSLVKVTSILH